MSRPIFLLLFSYFSFEVQSQIKFIVIGDFGQKGNASQTSVSKAMQAFVKQNKVDFIVSTGDNIYPNGVSSVEDIQWKESFEDVYPIINLPQKWYPVLGNHDYRGNIEAQISYSALDTRWNMKGKQYDLWMNDNSLHLIFLDSNPFEKEYQNPKSLEFLNVQKADTIQMKRWIDSVTSLKAKNIIVFAHHPLYSSGWRKKSVENMRSKLLPLIRNKNIDAYIAGHEHHLEHSKVDSISIDFFISGGGGATVREVDTLAYTRMAASKYGFMTIDVNKTDLVFNFYDENLIKIYSYTKIK